jgi:hypothetical protein
MILNWLLSCDEVRAQHNGRSYQEKKARKHHGFPPASILKAYITIECLFQVFAAATVGAPGNPDSSDVRGLGMQKVLAYAKTYHADCVPQTAPLFPELVVRTVNS